MLLASSTAFIWSHCTTGRGEYLLAHSWWPPELQHSRELPAVLAQTITPEVLRICLRSAAVTAEPHYLHSLMLILAPAQGHGTEKNKYSLGLY